MATSPYQPVTVTSESLTQAKLQQMANNDQWLFENTPRVRYTYGAAVRDASVKIITGKVYFPAQTVNWVTVGVSLGSFFTPGCRPVINATPESPDTGRVDCTIHTWTGQGEIDNTGFTVHAYVQQLPNDNIGSGWIHWMAVGY